MVGRVSRSLSLAIIFLIILALAPTLSLGATDGGASPLERLIKIALERNPDLQAAEARARSYESKAGAAGILNDPSLSLSLSNYPVDTFSDNQTPMTGKVIRLSQELPFPGKLAARKELAVDEARWYDALARESRLRLVRQVKEAYYNLYYYDRAVAITGTNLAVLDDLIKLTETNYAVGKGLQQDVLKAQVERSKLLDKRYSFQQQRDSGLAALNRLAGREPATALAELPEISPAEHGTSLAEWRAASKNRPMVAAYTALVERYRAQKKLARLDYKPDFRIGLAYTSREPSGSDPGTDFAGIEFGFNLPIWRKKRSAEVADAAAGEDMALAQYRDYTDRVAYNIQDAWNRLATSADQAALYRTGLIPQATQTLQAARSAYQVGRLGLLPVLDDLTLLYNYELQYQKVLCDGQRSLARLEAESGRTALLSGAEAKPTQEH